MNLGEGDTLLAIARNAEESADETIGEIEGVEESDG
jgi:DNA gyrase subunit A